MFRLLDSRVFIGANIHCTFPAVAGRLEFVQSPPPGTVADAIASLRPYVSRLLPELATVAALPAPSTLNLPAEPHAAVGLIVAWLASQLQNLAAAHISDYAVDYTGKGEVFALCGYQVPEAAVEAMRLACVVVLSGWQPDATPAATSTGPELRQQLETFMRSGGNCHLDQTTHAIINAARARNIPHYRLSPSARFVQLGQGVYQHHIFESESDRTSVTGTKISHNKTATHHLLRSLGIPTPAQVSVSTFEQAAEAVSQLGFPLVIKPSHGMQGIGITVGVNEWNELTAAVQRAAEAQRGGVLVEEYVAGHDHRLLVVNGKLVAAARRIPAHVVGDGIHNIEQLVAVTNQDPRRGSGFNKELVKISMDNETARVLASQGYGYSSVPPREQVVPLCGTANISTGGVAIDVTSQVHPEIREMAELIARAFKLDVAGIDYLTTDISRSWREIGGAVCEVNACPGLRPHWVAGTPRGEVLDPILDMHFPDAQNGRVPVVAITGSSGKTTTARMVAAILEASGKTTGLASTDGVSVGKSLIREGDCAGGRVARSILMDPRVEAAVMELARGGLIRVGVPVDACDVGVVLNVAGDHLGEDGIASIEELARVKLLVPKAASRYAVLNADDPHCVMMAERLRPLPVCWVSVDPGNPLLKSHAGAGGISAMLSGSGKDAHIVVANGTRQQIVASVREIPSTMNGLVYVNAVNALFAAAIAYALDMPLPHIRKGLSAFQNDFNGNPGRFNLHRGARGLTVLDRADSPHDMRAFCSMISELPTAGRRIIAFTCPGNRQDSHIADIAEQVAGRFDHYVCYSWDDLRERKPHEVPSLLAASLEKHGVPQDAISVIPLQDEAIAHALQLAANDDLVAVVNHDVGARLCQIWNRISSA